MSRLRFEVWNNAHTHAIARNGEQDITYTTSKATKFSVGFSHPDVYELFCIQEFKTLAERKAFINSILDEA